MIAMMIICDRCGKLEPDAQSSESAAAARNSAELRGWQTKGQHVIRGRIVVHQADVCPDCLAETRREAS